MELKWYSWRWSAQLINLDWSERSIVNKNNVVTEISEWISHFILVIVILFVYISNDLNCKHKLFECLGSDEFSQSQAALTNEHFDCSNPGSSFQVVVVSGCTSELVFAVFPKSHREDSHGDLSHGHKLLFSAAVTVKWEIIILHNHVNVLCINSRSFLIFNQKRV